MKPVHLIVAVAGIGSLVGLAGCAMPSPKAPTSAPTHSAAQPMAGNGAKSSPLEAKRALFDETNRRTSRSSSPTGAAFIAGLQGAGFATSSLEVTTDVTSVGLTAPSIQFAALVDSTCLIGQYGPDGSGYRSLTAAPIATGQCLIGTPTRR